MLSSKYDYNTIFKKMSSMSYIFLYSVQNVQLQIFYFIHLFLHKITLLCPLYANFKFNLIKALA